MILLIRVQKIHPYQFVKYLNSIMILLIRHTAADLVSFFINLNSIMILLILIIFIS